VTTHCSPSKFALEAFFEAPWQEIEPLGLRAMVIEPGSFRTGIQHRTKTSGVPIDNYTRTAGGMFRSMEAEITPEMFSDDPEKAARVISGPDRCP
jgi:NAD(P)-dependent dehydrogenase (short-subunit alcohol dehydrogenase family)